MTSPTQSLPPGFRFHPTDEELILHYLRNRASSVPCPVSIIAEVDIYKFNPWELPRKALFGEQEWYFFSPRDRKYPNGVRPNRSAASGYWKATGTDKPIGSAAENVAVKKALVFYKGRPPKGVKTNWIMHEYRLAEAHAATNCYRPLNLRDASMRLDDWVLCRIYKKSTASEATEQEVPSSTDNASISSFPSITQQENEPKMTKTCSVSDFLEDYSAISHLFEDLPEMPAPEVVSNPSAKQPMTNYTSSANGNGPQTASPALVAGNHLKRQAPAAEEEIAHPTQPSKKMNDSCSFTTMANPFDGTQYGMMNQSLLNHH